MTLAARSLVDLTPKALRLNERVAWAPPRCLVLAEAGGCWEIGADRARSEFDQVHVLHEWPGEGAGRFLERAWRRLGASNFGVVTLAVGDARELSPRLRYFERLLERRDGVRLKLVRLVCPASKAPPAWVLDLAEILTSYAVGVELIFG